MVRQPCWRMVEKASEKCQVSTTSISQQLMFVADDGRIVNQLLFRGQGRETTVTMRVSSDCTLYTALMRARCTQNGEERRKRGCRQKKQRKARDWTYHHRLTDARVCPRSLLSLSLSLSLSSSRRRRYFPATRSLVVTGLASHPGGMLQMLSGEEKPRRRHEKTKGGVGLLGSGVACQAYLLSSLFLTFFFSPFIPQLRRR
jgi:hypothetical protein